VWTVRGFDDAHDGYWAEHAVVAWASHHTTTA